MKFIIERVFYSYMSKNSLKPYIENLVNTCKILMDDEEEDFDQGSFVFLPAVTEYEINCWEKENNINIPDSYKEWLMFANGAKLCNSMVELYSLSDLIVDNESKPYNVPDDYIVLGEFTAIEETYCFSRSSGMFKVFSDIREAEVSDFSSILEWITERIG